MVAGASAPVLANTQYQSACTTPDIQHLVPLRTQSSPSLTALVRMPITSLPACGSESPNAARCAPSAMPGRYFCFCSSLPAIITGPVGRRVSSSISAAVFEYFATSSMAMRQAEDPGAAAAVLLRDAQPEQAGVAEQLEEVLRVLARLVDLAGPRLDLVLRQAPHGLLQGQQFVGKRKIHPRTVDKPA